MSRTGPNSSLQRLIDEDGNLTVDLNLNIEDSPPPAETVRRLIIDNDNTGRGKNPRIDVPPLSTDGGGDDGGGGDDDDDGGGGGGGGDDDIDPFVPGDSIFQLYKKFAEEDVFIARKQKISGGSWTKGQRTLNAFFTSSEQSSSLGDYYYDIYDEDPTTSPDTAEIQFSVAYGHIDGGGSLSIFSGSNESYEPTKAIYKQFANILLDAFVGEEQFEFNESGSDDVYAVLLSRDTLKEKMKPGSWQLTLDDGNAVRTFTDYGYVEGTDTLDFSVQNSYPIISASLDVVPSETNYEIARETDKGQLQNTVNDLTDNDSIEIATTSSDGLPIESEKVTLSQSIWETNIKNGAYPELSGAFASYGGQINSSLWTAYSQSYNDLQDYLFEPGTSASLTPSGTGSNPGFLSSSLMNTAFDFTGSESLTNPDSKVYYKEIFSDHWNKEIALRNEFFTQVGSQLTAVTQSFEEFDSQDRGFGTFYPKLGLMLFNPTALVDIGLTNLDPNTSTDAYYDNNQLFYNSLSSFKNIFIEELITNHYDVKLRRVEFNFSNNPSFASGSEREVKSEFQEDPVVYITKVGLYNDQNELLAVARPSQPIKKTFNNEVVIRTKLDF